MKEWQTQKNEEEAEEEEEEEEEEDDDDDDDDGLHSLHRMPACLPSRHKQAQVFRCSEEVHTYAYLVLVVDW